MADDEDQHLQKEEGVWSVCVDSNKYQTLGFLQMCIERRFHLAVQGRFMAETGLGETDYWIHTEIGGSPKMEHQVDAPEYCYDPPHSVRKMGWSAHGSKCGGYDGVKDELILEALQKTLNEKPRLYPDAEHFGFFARQGQIIGEVEVLLIRPE